MSDNRAYTDGFGDLNRINLAFDEHAFTYYTQDVEAGKVKIPYVLNNSLSRWMGVESLDFEAEAKAPKAKYIYIIYIYSEFMSGMAPPLTVDEGAMAVNEEKCELFDEETTINDFEENQYIICI